MATSEKSTNRAPGLILAACIALLTFVVFLPVSGYGFLFWDDLEVIRDNPIVKNGLSELGQIFTLDFVRFMPVSWLAFKAIAECFGMDPTAFHFANLLLHSLNAGLLALLLYRITSPGNSSSQSLIPAATLAMLWSWHPLRAEPVAWAVDLYYLLAGTFLLLSLNSLISFFRQHSLGSAVLSTVFLGLSICSYPPALTWAAAIPLLWLLLGKAEQRDPLSISSLLRAIKESAPLWFPGLLISFAVIATTVFARTTEDSPWYHGTGEALGLTTRMLHAAYSYAGLLFRNILPLELTPAWQPDEPTLRQILPLVGLIALAAFLLIRRTPVKQKIIILLAMSVISSVPLMGLTEGNYIQPDRFTYCMAILLSLGVAALIRNWPTSIRVWVPCGLVCLALIPISRGELVKWSSSEALYDHLENVSWIQESYDLQRQVKFIRARYYTSESEFEKARIIFDELIADTNNSFVWREAARNEALAGKLDHSIELLEKNLSIAPDGASTVLLKQIRAIQAAHQP